MIIKCEKNISKENYEIIIGEIKKHKVQPDILRERNGKHNPVLGLKGDCTYIDTQDFSKLEGILEVKRIGLAYKLASREYRQDDTVIKINDILIGGGNPIVFMAGPCSVESEYQIKRIAKEIEKQGASILRGGAWKPRTFARKFEGKKEEALKYLKKAKDETETKMPIVTEVTSSELIEKFDKYIDIYQVGTRKMQDFDLLDKLGKQNKPVLLKRGFSAKIDEFLGAADRILYGGNNNVMLCLRGVRTFDYSQRFPADLYAIPDLKRKTHLPIIFDPSHSAGDKKLVPGIARMAIAGGVNGLLIETHYNPSKAASDGKQTITPETLGEIIRYARMEERLIKNLK